MSDSAVRHEEVYRGRYAHASAVGALGLAVFVAVDALTRGDAGTAALTVGAVLFALALVYALAFRPAVSLNAERVRLVNVVREIVVPWSQVAGVRTRWTLVVETEDGRTFPSWAISAGRPAADGAPARGAPAGWSTSTGGASPHPRRGHADTVKQAVLRRWEAWLASGREPSGRPVEVAWAWPSIAALAAGTAALVVAVVVA